MKRISIDLHDMPVIQAKCQIQTVLKNCKKDTDEIEVIHGFHSGDKILKYVRTDLKHPRIQGKILGLNNGITILVLKK